MLDAGQDPREGQVVVAGHREDQPDRAGVDRQGTDEHGEDHHSEEDLPSSGPSTP